MVAMQSRMTLAVGAILIAAVVYGGNCVLTSRNRNLAFDAIVAGDTEQTVLDRFGTAPSIRERRGVPFRRYASNGCAPPCGERWWFENRLSFDVEAWSITFDEERRVIAKARWVSP